MKYGLLALIFIASQTSLAQVQTLERDGKQNYVIRYLDDKSSSILEGVWVPGNLVQPSTEVIVTRDSTDKYKYEYKVSNKEGASVDLYEISIKTESNISAIKANKGWHSRYIRWKSSVQWSHTEGPPYGIKPGTQQVFSFKTSELPGIGLVKFSNLTGSSFPSEDEELPVAVAVVLDSLREIASYVQIKTIVPRKLSNEIENSVLLDTLYSYLAFSCGTTWIENQGICNSLGVKLDNVEKQLQKDNNKTASNDLQAFLNQLNALKEKQVSNEAYALLYYNASYLKERLEKSDEN